MTDKTPVDSGMSTRLRSSKTTTDQQSNSVADESETPEWQFPETKSHGRQLVTNRVEAYFKNFNSLPNHDQLKAEWTRLKEKTSTPYHPSLLEFIINKLESKSVQYMPNYTTCVQLKKAKFLEPFSIDMETNWFVKPASTSVPVTTTYHEQLLQICHNTFKNIPMTYSSTDTTIDGKQVWTTEVSHAQSYGRIQGSGTASTKSASQEQAAKHALEYLAQNPVGGYTTTNTPKTHTKTNATVVEPEKDELVDVIITTNDNTDDDDSAEHFSQQQLALIQKETKTTMQICFQDFFDKAIDNMASIFDKRIHTIIEETFESHFNEKFSHEIQKHVESQTLLSIQKEVKNEVQSKVTDHMKEKVQNAVFNAISNRAQVECKQIFQNQFVRKVNNHITTAELEIQKRQVEAIERIQDEVKSGENTLKQLNIRDRADINTRRNQLNKSLKNDFDGYLAQMENEVEEHINNINDVTATLKQQLQDIPYTKPPPVPEPVPSHKPFFDANENVIYTDTTTGQQCHAWIVEEHDEDVDNIYYTIKFVNNNIMKTAQHNLTKIPTANSTHPLFPNVNVEQIMSTTRSPLLPVMSHPIASRNISTDKYLAPSPFDLKAFHQQFQPKLSSDADILTFYNQLKSQGRKYNIYLRDLNEIGPESDICPDGVDPKVREDMALAIYQKLQNENSRDFTYEHLENCMEQHSDTSDGYYTIRELLRKVHPQLKVGKKIHDIPKLSECNLNLFTLAKELKLYFKQQSIQGRKYKAKEQSEIYLQQLDDQRYAVAKTKCLIDLNLATMHGPDNIAQHALTFEALPATVESIAEIDDGTPIVRAMAQRPKTQQREYVTGRKHKKGYEPMQCRGCKQWGHSVSKCQTIPKIALVNKFIDKNPTQTQALINEYLRVNNKNVKRSTVRALQESGIIDNEIESLQYLNETDIDIDTFSVEFDQPIAE